MRGRASLFLRLSLLLFVVTVPFEALNVSLSLGPISVARFAGLGLFAMSALHFKKCYAIVPRPMWFFLAYLAIYVASGLSGAPLYASIFTTELFTFVQLLALFLITSNLLRDQKLCGQVLLTYAIATALLGLAIMLNLPGFSQEVYVNRIEGARVSALGANPNYLGIVFATAAVILIGAASLKKLRRVLIVFPLIVVLVMLVQTASRGAVAALVVGVSSYFVTFATFRRKPMVAALAGLGVVGLLYLIMSSPDFMSRWTRAREGDSAGRDHIMDHTLSMLSERPLLGWGPIEYRGELMIRDKGKLDTAGGMQTPHNLEFELLLQVGIIGAIPFLAGLGFCGLSAWKARGGELGLLPFALLATLLVGNQFHIFTGTKPMWLVLAACAAASTGAVAQAGRRQEIIRPLYRER